MKRLSALCSFFLLFVIITHAQQSFPEYGVRDDREGLYALTNATIFVDYQTSLENATILCREGKILALGSSVTIPEDAVVLNMEGKYIYPSFIDIYAEYGLSNAPKLDRPNRRGPQFESLKKGAFGWNQAIQPEFEAHTFFYPDEKSAADYRNEGFGAVMTHRMDGISRGASAVVSLKDDNPHHTILKPIACHHLSFNKGSSSQNYPSSLMGAIALIRQTALDAEWYAAHGHKLETNLSLEAWNKLKSLPHIFEVRDWQEALRAGKIAEEFAMNIAYMGAGDEYRRLNELGQLNAPFIIPVNFPEAYDVADPYDANLIELDDLKHWELAPHNPGLMAQANIPMALTTHGLEKKSQFLSMIRKAIDNGLSEQDALKALTFTPAKISGIDQLLGSLDVGKLANFIVSSGPLFQKDTKIIQNWVQGTPYLINNPEDRSLAGSYKLQVSDTTFTILLSGNSAKPEGKIVVNDSTSQKLKVTINQNFINLQFENAANQSVRLSGIIQPNGNFSGNADPGNGTLPAWKAIKFDEESPSETEDKEESAPDLTKPAGKIIYPFTAYGNIDIPIQENWLIKNATVWTNERDGILTQTDVLIKNGKIAAIGQNLDMDFANVIDATGKHLTPGIIDEHSHIAISRGVNEGTQYSSAEVSIGDVINAEDVNIYRQLAGGVTASQLLHGSANPIGGQSGIIKLRWGFTPEEMKIKDAAPFIKFALGENVKQSNWGDDNRIRYPQTRMGVEQTFDDHFTRATEYGKLKNSGKPYRIDLEMEAILQILNKERFISCHSYQQGEINMLMKIAEKHGFTVNTFTHILEGYKVADKLAAHGAGASSFSDWWAYKYEVIDAIPYNGAILHEQGVVTAFNSDDAEMARRLNQEAAKAVKYGGMSEEEALKLVTLNPAILLHLDNRMGSIRVGKDADLVIWSDHPLSVYAQAEKTFIDGIKFYDQQEDTAKRDWIRNERARIIQKMLATDKKGSGNKPPRGKYHHLYHCDDIHNEIGDYHKEAHTHQDH